MFKEKAFTIEQYIQDVKDNAAHLLRSKRITEHFGNEVVFLLPKHQEQNARASRIVPGQYLIEINEGLLRGCLEFFDERGRSY